MLKFLQKPPYAVILTSFLILYLELALIRFIPAHVLYFGFFTNFVLIASFLGIGLGVLLSRQKINLIIYFPWLLLGLIILTQLFSTGLNIDSSEVIFFRGVKLDKQPIAVPGSILLPLLFICMAAVFCPLGQYLGRFFTQTTNTIVTYIQDLLGSILGILIFSIISYLSLPPLVWFALFEAIFLLVAVKNKRQLILFGLILTISTLLTYDFGSAQYFWSPYYKITLIKNPVTGGGLILANNAHHQHFSNYQYAPFYSLVFANLRTKSFLDQVLIIGSGSGQDVAAALSVGAKHVTAVEIDPQILQIGKIYHPQHPYQDNRVTIIVDDGRHFLRSTKQKFDLIIFALTDSLVLNSGLSEIRLESYLFTLESFKEAKDHLKDNGVFVLYNDYRKDWLVKRMENMLEAVFGSFNKLNVTQTSKIFSAKKGEANFSSSDQSLPTDDWPFLYLRDRSIPGFYLLIVTAVLLVSAGSIIYITRIIKKTQIISKHTVIFFLLGVSFSLLETKSIVQLNLLFGTTWFVNAVAFGGILVSVLIACLIIWKYRIRSSRLIWILLFISLAIQYLVPLNQLLVSSLILRLLLAVPFFYLPIFLANLIFANLFSQSKTSELDFGSNLLGLTFGGFLEYISLITGYSALVLIIGTFYLTVVYLKNIVKIAKE